MKQKNKYILKGYNYEARSWNNDMSNFLYNTPYNENINYLDNIKGKKLYYYF